MNDNAVRFSLSKDASTCLKGLACLLIVLHHWCSGLSGIGHDGFLVKLFTQAGGITGVAVFFFLSSYGLSLSQQKNSDIEFEGFVGYRNMVLQRYNSLLHSLLCIEFVCEKLG